MPNLCAPLHTQTFQWYSRLGAVHRFQVSLLSLWEKVNSESHSSDSSTAGIRSHQKWNQRSINRDPALLFSSKWWWSSRVKVKKATAALALLLSTPLNTTLCHLVICLLQFYVCGTDWQHLIHSLWSWTPKYTVLLSYSRYFTTNCCPPHLRKKCFFIGKCFVSQPPHLCM